MKGGPEGGGPGGIGVAASIGPSISGFRSLVALGSKLEAPIGSFVNEGPVRGGLEMFQPIGQINFNNQSGLNAADAVLGAQSILAQARSQPSDIVEPVYQTDPTDSLAQIAEDALQPSSLIATIESFLSEARSHKPEPDLFKEDVVAKAEQILGLDKPKVIVEPSVYQEEELQSVSPVDQDVLKLKAVRQRISLLQANKNTAVTKIVTAPQAEPNVIPSFIIAPALEKVVKPKSFLTTRVATQPQVETNTASVLASQTPIVEHQQEQVEELIEELVGVKDEGDQTQEENSEAGEEIKIQRVVDKAAVGIRIGEIIAAAVSVSEEGGIIEGQKIVKKLPSQNKKNRSGELNIIDPEGSLLDGSLLATVKKIASGKFASVLDVIKRVPKIVAEDIPVTRGEGQLVTDKDVAKVYEQYKGKIPPAKEIIKRVVRKIKRIKVIKKGEQSVQTIPVHEKIVEKNEGKPHAELAAALLVPSNFQKA